MLDYSRVQNYCIACGYTDMRKQIDGLTAVFELQFGKKLNETSIFLFCCQSRDNITFSGSTPYLQVKKSDQTPYEASRSRGIESAAYGKKPEEVRKYSVFVYLM